jgi:hypothetical protein
MNGQIIAWDEATPAGSESIGQGDNRIRSMKTDLRTALDDEHAFPASGGTAGYHRAGSARAFYGTQSRVSASHSTASIADGRLMFTSDTSRLFGVGSGGTAFIGGPTVPSLGSAVAITMPQRKHIVEEAGKSVVGAGARHKVDWPNSGFSELIWAGFTPLRAFSDESTVGSHVHFNIANLDVSGFSGIVVVDSDGGGVAEQSGSTLFWRALGTRAL